MLVVTFFATIATITPGFFSYVWTPDRLTREPTSTRAICSPHRSKSRLRNTNCTFEPQMNTKINAPHCATYKKNVCVYMKRSLSWWNGDRQHPHEAPQQHQTFLRSPQEHRGNPIGSLQQHRIRCPRGYVPRPLAVGSMAQDHTPHTRYCMAHGSWPSHGLVLNYINTVYRIPYMVLVLNGSWLMLMITMHGPRLLLGSLAQAQAPPHLILYYINRSFYKRMY